MKLKIGIITPISHLRELKNAISKKGEVYYLENGSKLETRDFIIHNKINALLCNPNAQNFVIDSELLEGTLVKIINTCSTGHNHIDESYLFSNGIELMSLKTDFELLNKLPSTSELALTLMLTLLRNIIPSVDSVKKYEWNYLNFVGRMASELRVGIIGYGRLGKMMAKFCEPLCKEVLIWDPYVKSEKFRNVNSIEKLFLECDVISIHVHVQEDTKHMINKKLLDLCDKSPLIINTSRGEIVCESDLIEALNNGKISGYGADVLEHEFSDIRNSKLIELMNTKNVVITPHIGGMTIEGQVMAFKWAIDKF